MSECVVIVCGGRDYGDVDALYRALDRWSPTLVINGGANGADALARQWARENRIGCQTYPADWHTHGKAAGPRRNAEMAARGAELQAQGASVTVLAFPGGKGTASMVAIAKRHGLDVVEVA